MTDGTTICNCDLCEARRLNCHRFEVYFGLDSLTAELVRANPDLPIYVYEQYAAYVEKGTDPKNPENRAWVLQAIKNYGKKREWRTVNLPPHPWRRFAPAVRFLEKIFGWLHRSLFHLRERLTCTQTMEEVK